MKQLERTLDLAHRHSQSVQVPISIRILLADDHPVVRRGLRALLEDEPDLVVAAEARDGAEALRIGLRGGIDLAILDVVMPRLNGLQVAAEHRRAPEVRTLMLSIHDSERYLFEALRAGARGYVLKTAAERELVAACRTAVLGGQFVYPRATTRLRRDFLERLRDWDDVPADPLTRRELEVLKLIAEAFTSEQIAQALVISRRTVDHHRASILAKLGMRDRVELTRYAIRRGLIQP